MIDGDAAMYPVTWICQWVDYKVLYCRVSSLCLEDDGSVVCWVGEYNWFSIHAFWIYITLAYNLCLNHNSLITLLPLCPFESRLNSLDQIFFFKYATYVTHGANRSKVVHSSICPSNIYKIHIPNQGHWPFWPFTSNIIGFPLSIIDNSIMGNLLLLY